MSAISSIGGEASLSQAQVQQQIGLTVARKALDTAKAQGDAAVSLIEQAAELQGEMGASGDKTLGHQIDVRV